MKKTNFLMLISVVSMILISCTSDEKIEDTLTTETALKQNSEPGAPMLFATLPSGAMGSTIGPGGDLFVTQSGAAGSILRIDKNTGEVSTFASGLPVSPAPIGGVTDVVFIDDTAYALVTLVGSFFGSDSVNGIYKITGPNSYEVVADIGLFANNYPPTTDFFLPEGLQFAIETYQGSFLVTDGHHNRVYRVTLEGDITIFKVFDNIVPTGLEVKGNTVYMSQTGPVPHFPEDGKIVSFISDTSEVIDVASGAPMLVDVEYGRGQTLFGLSQGSWIGVTDGDAAEPGTGALVRINEDGTLTTIANELDRPTSLEFIQNTAFIVTLTGEVWTVDNVASPPFGI